MKKFLGVYSESERRWRVSIADAPQAILIQQHGRSSPLLPATTGGPPAGLAEAGAIAFLLSQSPNQLLSQIANELDPQFLPRTYISHGHAAAVVLLDRMSEVEYLLTELASSLTGHEIWPHNSGIVERSSIITAIPPGAALPITSIDLDGLEFEAAAQLRQFIGSSQFRVGRPGGVSIRV